MTETYLLLLAGVIAGLISSFIGGIILYRNHLRTHLMFRDRVEEERSALYNDIAAIDKAELSETDAGKELMVLSQGSIRQFGYAREDLRISLRRHNYDLLKQIDESRKRLAQSEERLMAIAALQQESEKVIENLKKDNKELRLANSLRESRTDHKTSPNSAQFAQDLRITLEEVARLQNQLADANMRLVEVESEGITAFSQELRQTLASTLQYTNLLLGESVGTLNAMQRNFLESIKASTTRLNHVIQDFIQVKTLKAVSDTLVHESVDLNLLLKDAIDDTSSEVRAKRLSLKVDLPENLASVYVDRKALEQILIRLLSNAGAASPLQGTVRLQVQVKREDDKEYLLIQVSDAGGGIPPEDLSRVFIPLYRAEDVPARGVGETGMGLFLAKTLTESQNGRIWVDTELGVGSTYNVLIPIARGTTVNVSADK
jgi:signal transduction histidine kinase